MDRLPQELLRFIAKDVAYESLEPLRLVNRALAAAAAPFLFESIPLWIGARSLERLTLISEHPQLSKYPKAIAFSPLTFVDDEEDETFHKNKLKDSLEHQTAYALTKVKHMSVHRSYVEIERLLSLNALDVTILSRAFSRLPQLQTLQVEFWDPTIGSAEMIDVFGASNAGGLLAFDCCRTLPVIVKALAASAIKIKVFKLASPEARSYGSVSGKAKDDRAAYWERTQGVSEADLEIPGKLAARGLSDTFCGENMDIYKNALHSVRELIIGEVLIERYRAVGISKTVAALRNLMQCAKGLEIVTLGRFVSAIEVIPRPTLDDMMPSYYLNNVKELNIHWYWTTIVALSELFHQNCQTIVKVRFYDVAIIGSDWSKALIQLRTLDFLRLEVFLLSFDGDQRDLQAQDYILKKNDKDPIVEQELLLRKERLRRQFLRELGRRRRSDRARLFRGL